MLRGTRGSTLEPELADAFAAQNERTTDANDMSLRTYAINTLNLCNLGTVRA